jgi:hypothetical protein
MQTVQEFRQRVIDVFNNTINDLSDGKINTDINQINLNIKKLKTFSELLFNPNNVMNDVMISDKILSLIVKKQELRDQEEEKWNKLMIQS